MQMAMKRQLTDDEVLEQLMREKAEREKLIRDARANLERYGSTLPPLEVSVTKPATRVRGQPPPDTGVVRVTATGRGRGNAKRVPGIEWFNVFKVCPHCGEEKNVGRDFGTVIRRGRETAASWCKKCRANSNYHGPRDWTKVRRLSVKKKT